MSAPAAPARPSWWRFTGITGLYTVLGPLLGGFGVTLLLTLMSATVAAAQGQYDEIAARLGAGLFVTFVAGLPIVYTFGTVSTFAVGLAVAIGDRLQGGVSWRIALVAGGLAWLGALGVAGLVIPPSGFLTWVTGLLAGHALAVVLCTWLARLVFGGR